MNKPDRTTQALITINVLSQMVLNCIDDCQSHDSVIPTEAIKRMVEAIATVALDNQQVYDAIELGDDTNPF